MEASPPVMVGRLSHSPLLTDTVSALPVSPLQVIRGRLFPMRHLQEEKKTAQVFVEPGLPIEDCGSEFIPIARSGAWADIGFRQNMEDVYVCVDNFMHEYGLKNFTGGPNAFYGVFIFLMGMEESMLLTLLATICRSSLSRMKIFHQKLNGLLLQRFCRPTMFLQKLVPWMKPFPLVPLHRLLLFEGGDRFYNFDLFGSVDLGRSVRI